MRELIVMQELIQKEKFKFDFAEKLTQKQLQILKTKELAFNFISILSAVLLRVYMQFIPSAEPISLFALMNGWLFGWRKGLYVGVSALLISNFLVAGGNGPWTIFQAILS